ncbi:7-cyano-7-deazaguanine synthase [Aneurinibacillus tyrosinisolvens]|uniref:7-cyano-7-deazaguanine synthase n=1 Tax=Aneurinibacillus tyrosinisolvens TaxID=1443435 RepID=UPI00063F6F63|nr:7-cyano-7-deazaguanine synthase [Aneurinibacillus tyrosinisolvens]
MDVKSMVLLFSGGVDSTTLLALCQKNGYDVFPLYINYGQRACRLEEEAVRKLGQHYGVCVKRAAVPIPAFLNESQMINGEEEIPSIEDEEQAFAKEFVPHRNLFLLTLAAMYAHSLGISTVGLGVYSGSVLRYSDCTLEFLQKAQETIAVSSGNSAISIYAPFVHMDKENITKVAADLDVPIDTTVSCNMGVHKPCGVCSSCMERRRVLERIGGAGNG